MVRGTETVGCGGRFVEYKDELEVEAEVEAPRFGSEGCSARRFELVVEAKLGSAVARGGSELDERIPVRPPTEGLLRSKDREALSDWYRTVGRVRSSTARIGAGAGGSAGETGRNVRDARKPPLLFAG